MIRKMLWYTLIAAVVIVALGAAYQTFGPGTGAAALAGYTPPVKSQHKHRDH